MTTCARRLALVLLLTSWLSGCMHVPLGTIARLLMFDFSKADPAEIRAAFRVPQGLRHLPGGVRLDLAYQEQAGSAEKKRSFVLEEIKSTVEIGEVSRFGRPGYRAAGFKLSDADVEEIRALQVKLRSARNGGRGGRTGRIGVSAQACREGAMPAGPLLSSSYLKLSATETYLTVVEDIDLRQEIGEGQLAAQIRPCT